MGTDDLFKKRKAARKARAHNTRAPKLGAYLIVTEGERTEPLYFEALGKTVTDVLGGKVDIKVEGSGRGTIALVERASQIVSTSPRQYEHVWVVFDKDDFDDFDEAIALAESRGFEVAWSNQAFEFWLFLHFDYSDSALHRDDWKQKLDQIFKKRNVRSEGYEKNLDNLYELVTGHGNEDQAMASARYLREMHHNMKRTPSQSDPCTTVFELVNQLKSLVNQ